MIKISEISCKKCGNIVSQSLGITEKDFELHHIIPKSIDGTDLDGRIYLCKKCHSNLHNYLPKQIFKFVPEEKKEECRKQVKSFTLWWLKNGF